MLTMGGREKRYYIIIGMLLVSVVLTCSLERSRGEGYKVRLKEFPMSISTWQGRDVELKKLELVYAVLETTSILSRIYENSRARGEVVDLLVTYFERGHRGFHPPEVSFVAQGNTIIKSGIVHIPLADGANAPGLEANMFLGKTPIGEVLFLYWFGIGDRSMASYYKGSVYLLWNTLLQRPTTASMVRVSLPLVNGDFERTMLTARGFIRQIVPMLPKYMTQRPPA